MTNANEFTERLKARFNDKIDEVILQRDEVTIEVSKQHLLDVVSALRDDPAFAFSQLIDLCGVDYLEYGMSEWETTEATATGFERGVTREKHYANIHWNKPRFAVVYHLLSMHHNQRLRVRCFLHHEDLFIPSITPIWNSANWFEREAFDLFGILFENHPDLRRILTDYNFDGHPFRKDFPLIGKVELRYDATQQRCVYEPVSIQPRILVPRVIRPEENAGEAS